ncbi:NUDIX hydrolase [Aspergillus undulatus]|uniref:NUDIX hydrolase n=1 Tax=Aspergillus undulatus TaxID=1810928 RepID=UPI003CCCCECD
MPEILLDIVKECDNFYIDYLHNYYNFKISSTSQVFGHVPKAILQAFDFAMSRITTRLPDGNKITLLEIAHSASSLIGILAPGVQVICYVKHPTCGLLLWVGRRSRNKQTYPGMLDSTTAGGLESAFADQLREAAVRETVQKASLDKGFVRERLVITTLRLNTSYDLELPLRITPVPGDGEVENFYLWDIDEVLEALKSGEFKLNSDVGTVGDYDDGGEIGSVFPSA